MGFIFYNEASVSPKGLIVTGFKRWRILTKASNDGSLFYICIGEINFRETLGVDSPMNGTLKVDSIYGAGYEANKAIDNDPATAWITPAGNIASQHWFEMETPAVREVKQVKLQAYANAAGAGQMVKSFDVQFFDGTTWITEASFTNQTGWAPSEVRTFNL
jgi:hypothetical protein